MTLNEFLHGLRTDPVTTVGVFLADYGLNLVRAVLVYVIGRWIGSCVVSRFLERLLLRAKVDPTLAGFFRNISYAALTVFVVIAALGELGLQTTSLVALIGAAGLAVAFALQGSLANFAAGILIITFRPFRKGDLIEAAGTSGTVDEIQIFSTVLTTLDNRRVFIPNSAITSGNIVNFTANPVRRIDMVFGVSYADDLLKVRQILERILRENPRVLKDPVPAIAVGALADNSVNFNVRPWVKTADYWTVHAEVHEAVKREFDNAGVSIPFPQRDVHLRRVAPARA